MSTLKEQLLRKIADRIRNNVGITEFADEREPELDITDCMKLIENDLKLYQIRKKL